MAAPLKTSKRNRKPKRSTGPWVTYERCFLMTLGACFSGLSLLGIKVFSSREDQGPEWLPVMFFCLFFLGLFLISVGIFAARKDADSMARDSIVHEVVLIVWIIAAPLYFLLKAFEKRRK